MKKISVMELKKVETLARAVVNSNGSILLYEGAEIKPEHISKLMDNDIHHVFIQNDYAAEAESFTLEAIEKDSVDMIRDVIEKRIREDNESDMQKLFATAKHILEDIVKNPEIANCMLEIKRKRSDMYSHMLNVASLSTVMGIKLGMSQQQLNDMAIGALLHDIGLCDIGVPFENVEIDRLPAVDKLNYRKHVIQGYELLQHYEWMSETAKLIVLSHHEREDGSGYPFHKIGDRIPMEVKLVSICDHFDELANGIGHRRRKVHEVVEFFRTSGTYIFDFNIFSEVVVNIAWFPTGGLVITNTGDIARVIKQNKGLPDRPVIKIIRNAKGEVCKEEIIQNLTECLTVFILDTFEE